jgi:peptide/nickel transport system ATP-binding protein
MERNMDDFVEITGLSKDFPLAQSFLTRLLTSEKPRQLKAVQEVSFTIRKNETFALVGESGSGKSTIAKMIVGLLAPTLGEIIIDKTPMRLAKNTPEMQALRARIAMIFQDPYASLNPRWRVFDTIAEPLFAFNLVQSKAQAQQEVAVLLQKVGLDPQDSHKFPHEFSGGQRQRIAIARALAAKPEFIICDEPTSALDVSVQAQILNLMKDLQEEFGLTYLIISHNLAVIRHMAHRVGVLYLGRLVEVETTQKLFESPQHPYTQMLLDAIPSLQPRTTPRKAFEGEIPNPLSPPQGCAFHPRCALASAICRTTLPPLINNVSCHNLA